MQRFLGNFSLTFYVIKTDTPTVSFKVTLLYNMPTVRTSQLQVTGYEFKAHSEKAISAWNSAQDIFFNSKTFISSLYDYYVVTWIT